MSCDGFRDVDTVDVPRGLPRHYPGSRQNEEYIAYMDTRTGTTFVIATHDVNVAEAANRSIHIVDGLVADQDSAALPTGAL